jgi:flagellar hook protein FlgE
MVASFYNGVSGAKSLQTAIDTWGDNIANVNTVGFRANNVEFDAMLNQSLAQPANSNNADGAGVGTINQVGLGVRVSATVMVNTQGSIQQTENNFDLAIQGDGWFAVQGPNDNLPAYTRNGVFNVDEVGNFTTDQGYKVLGMTSTNMTVNADGTGVVTSLENPPNLLTKAASPIVLPYQMTCPGEPAIPPVIISMPPQTKEHISGSDMEVSYTLPFSTPATVVITNANGEVVNTLYPEQNVSGDNKVLWNAKDANGDDIPTGTYYATVNYVKTPGIPAVPDGNLLAYSVGQGGEIIANFDNGKSVTVAQVPLYHFQNDQGLERMGDNLYTASANSGDAFLSTDVTTNEPTNGAVILSQALEMSNVSLSESMTNLIITQRSFDANAKCIKTSDEMIQRAISLKRG